MCSGNHNICVSKEHLSDLIAGLMKSSGSAAVLDGHEYFAIDNGGDGFDLHRLSSGAYIRSFPSDPTERTVPRQVRFGENGTIVVGGGNDGKVYVYKSETASVIDLLYHSTSARCQTVTVSLILRSKCS